MQQAPVLCQKALAHTVEGFWGHGWGQWLFLKFQKRRENEKKPPKSCDFGSFSWRRRRDLRTELRRERGVSPSKAGANKAIPPSIGVSRLTGYQTDQPRQKENPPLTGRVLFLAEKERFEFREVDFNPSYTFYMFVRLRFWLDSVNFSWRNKSQNMTVGVGIGVRKLLLFAKIFHCFLLLQASLHASDCVALYMHQKFAFVERTERIFCESSECSCEWIEECTSKHSFE